MRLHVVAPIKKIIIRLNLVNLLSLPLLIFRLCGIKRNKIVFSNYSGQGFGDNAKYIYQHLPAAKVDVCWLVTKRYANIPHEIRQVKIGSIAYFYHLATAKIWVNNMRFDQYVKKRKRQYYIQTWHGDLQLKKIEYDAIDKMVEYYKKCMKNDTRMTDLMISNSEHFTTICRRAFRFDGEIMEVGSPRNDILFCPDPKIRQKVLDYFGNISSEEKICLYAPTFRKSYRNNPYDLNPREIKEQLEASTGQKWKVLVRLHPNIKNPEELIKNLDYTENANNYPDMQELIMSCDLLITDYSSVMFDAMIVGKPVVLYIADYKDYAEERDYYFGFDELPFDIAYSHSDIIRIITENSYCGFRDRYAAFEKRVGLKETGRAGKLVADKIIQVIGEDK